MKGEGNGPEAGGGRAHVLGVRESPGTTQSAVDQNRAVCGRALGPSGSACRRPHGAGAGAPTAAPVLQPAAFPLSCACRAPALAHASRPATGLPGAARVQGRVCGHVCGRLQSSCPALPGRVSGVAAGGGGGGAAALPCVAAACLPRPAPSTQHAMARGSVGKHLAPGQPALAAAELGRQPADQPCDRPHTQARGQQCMPPAPPHNPLQSALCFDLPPHSLACQAQHQRSWPRPPACCPEPGSAERSTACPLPPAPPSPP